MENCEALLSLSDFSYSYDGEKKVLNKLNIDIYQGEKIAVLGRNGAGKSTFMLSLNGIIKPDTGVLYYRGKAVKGNKDIIQLRQKVGVVFQDAASQLIGPTVKKEISFGLMNLGIKKDEMEKRISNVLESLNLTEFENKPPHYLSGGEKKRVTIADILVMEPELILFDEPEASLDYYNRTLFENELDKMHLQNKTLIISTHNADFAWQWADRVLVFHNGELIGDNSPEKIFSDDNIIRISGLHRPMLYEIGAKVAKAAGRADLVYPKNIEELDSFISECQLCRHLHR